MTAIPIFPSMSDLLRIVESSHRGSFDADQAKEIGDCVIVAIAKITGLPWKSVFAAARPYFDRTGLNSGDTWRILRGFGWEMHSYYKLDGMTVRQAEAFLREHAPTARLICTINARGVQHAIAFADGRFHNVRGAYRARIGLADVCQPMTGKSANNAEAPS